MGGGWLGQWFHTVAIIRLFEPSLAKVGAGVEIEIGNRILTNLIFGIFYFRISSVLPAVHEAKFLIGCSMAYENM